MIELCCYFGAALELAWSYSKADGRCTQLLSLIFNQGRTRPDIKFAEVIFYMYLVDKTVLIAMYLVLHR